MKSDFRRKIHDLNSLMTLLEQWKRKQETIVFTNGCFDLLHLGHIDYLEKASQLGDRLIVAINSDESVHRLKGSTRPIQNQSSRAALIAAFGCVAAVILFDSDTPLLLIEAIRPDYLVKGGDWKPEQIAGADLVQSYGGKIIIVPLIPGYSTTRIEQKIKQSV